MSSSTRFSFSNAHVFYRCDDDSIVVEVDYEIRAEMREDVSDE